MIKKSKILKINFQKIKSDLNQILLTAGEIIISFIAIMSAVLILALICVHIAAFSQKLATILFPLGLGIILFGANNIAGHLIDLAITKKEQGEI